MTEHPIMKCGHAANAINAINGKPICVICVGIDAGAGEVAEQPDLSTRFAVCAYSGHAKVPSNPDLAFFEHRPEKDFDAYYCGCRGWD